MEKKIILGLMSFLILGSMFSLVSAELESQPPQITIQDVQYLDQYGDPITRPYYSWEKLYVEALIEDPQHYYDVRSVDLIFGEYTLSCWRDDVVSEDIALYKCSMSILPSWHGLYEVNLVAVDKAGLQDQKSLGNFWFNPISTLTHDPLEFSPLVMGEISETDWIDVDITTEAKKNPIEVVVRGKNLYSDRGQCDEETVCRRYEKVCTKEVVGFKTKTKRVCEKVAYNKTYSKRVCERVDGKRVCERVYYNKTKYKTECERVPYEVPIEKKVCRETDVCESWKTIKTNCEFSGSDNCGGSNTLELENFQYMLEGGEWEDLPSHNEVIFEGIGDSSFKIKFRVDIPASCYGNYILDGRNIFLELH